MLIVVHEYRVNPNVPPPWKPSAGWRCIPLEVYNNKNHGGIEIMMYNVHEKILNNQNKSTSKSVCFGDADIVLRFWISNINLNNSRV